MFNKNKIKAVGVYKFVKRDKDGNIVPLWQENAIGSLLLKYLKKEIHLPFITGGMVLEYRKKNLVVNTGLASISDLLGNVDSITAFSYIGLGTSNTAASAAQTTLVAEISADGLERAQGTVTQEDTNVTDDTLQIVKTFTYTGSGSTSIQEVGVFNAASDGLMYSRSVVTAKTVDTSGETLTVTYQTYFENA